MDIQLTPEQEKIIKDKLDSGEFQSAEQVIGQALQSLRQSAATPSNGTQREAVREMLAFVEQNHVRLDGISVKDLIHEGHRL